MVTNIAKRPPGRPKGFIPDEALDRAVEMFWEHGYEGVDVDRIARAVNVTKPALYRAFGDKSTLLLRAVERYALIVWSSQNGGVSSGARHPQGRDHLLRGYGQHRYRRRSQRLHVGRRCAGTFGAGDRDPFLAREGPHRIR